MVTKSQVGQLRDSLAKQSQETEQLRLALEAKTKETIDLKQEKERLEQVLQQEEAKKQQIAQS